MYGTIHSMKKLLGIFAHPDDELYEPGGTLAKYAKAGWQVDLVCATHGEAGERGAYANLDKKEFGVIRQKELESAAAFLGVRSITFLDYLDGKLPNLTPGDLEDKLVKVLNTERPDVVITFEPAGITNHPDHIKLTLSTTYAFQQYATLRYTEAPEDPNPPKLFFVCEPQSIVEYFQKKGYMPDESFSKPWKGVDDKRITTVIDIRRLAASKAKALRSHVSQNVEIEEYLEIPNNPFMKQEYFILRMIGLEEVFLSKNDRISDRL